MENYSVITSTLTQLVQQHDKNKIRSISTSLHSFHGEPMIQSSVDIAKIQMQILSLTVIPHGRVVSCQLKNGRDGTCVNLRNKK